MGWLEEAYRCTEFGGDDSSLAAFVTPENPKRSAVAERGEQRRHNSAIRIINTKKHPGLSSYNEILIKAPML